MNHILFLSHLFLMSLTVLAASLCPQVTHAQSEDSDYGSLTMSEFKDLSSDDRIEILHSELVDLMEGYYSKTYRDGKRAGERKPDRVAKLDKIKGDLIATLMQNQDPTDDPYTPAQRLARTKRGFIEHHPDATVRHLVEHHFEQEWQDLLAYLERTGIRPKLKSGRDLNY